MRYVSFLLVHIHVTVQNQLQLRPCQKHYTSTAFTPPALLQGKQETTWRHRTYNSSNQFISQRGRNKQQKCWIPKTSGERTGSARPFSRMEEMVKMCGMCHCSRWSIVPAFSKLYGFRPHFSFLIRPLEWQLVTQQSEAKRSQSSPTEQKKKVEPERPPPTHTRTHTYTHIHLMLLPYFWCDYSSYVEKKICSALNESCSSALC